MRLSGTWPAAAEAAEAIAETEAAETAAVEMVAVEKAAAEKAAAEKVADTAMSNTFGHQFTLTTFGESHGAAIGGVVDGMPPGIDIDLDFIQSELNRRRPGQSTITTSRQEADKVELLSGVFEGKSTGCPIGFMVRNENQHSQDYENLRTLFRPSHADYTYYKKYGLRDHRGGGRSSARITISRVVAGVSRFMPIRRRWATSASTPTIDFMTWEK